MTVTDRDGFYRTALGILARDGREGLRISTLCKELGVTTGSFHHWFAGWPGFVDYLLDRWEQEETLRLREIALGQATAQERINSLRRFALSFPHDAEAAIRSWAHLDPVVAAVQHRVDAAREDAIFAALTEAVPDPDLRRTRASLALAVLIGYQQRHDVPEAPDLEVLLDELLRLQGLLDPGAGS
ncbi:TetR/AcrR family transcriptional regulator [Marmoricola sp. RAF53]|uniref:TetR/AcrR family transcriptional regulator n=1 Tax=Marmoricola sp. RAF53 TaxID=3233059 RepID=UPI003F99B68A